MAFLNFLLNISLISHFIGTEVVGEGPKGNGAEARPVVVASLSHTKI